MTYDIEGLILLKRYPESEKMQLPSLKEITDKAQSAFRRFPITLVWAIFGSLYVLSLIDYSEVSKFNDNLDAVLTLILGISWLIGTQFFLEQRSKPKKWIWAKAAVVVLLFLFYWHLPNGDELQGNPEFIVRFFLYLIGGHLFLLFAPFIKRWHKGAYWNYLKSVGFAIGRSGIFSGVLFLGLVLALVAIDALFEVRLRAERYTQLFVFCLGVVNTWIYLSDFPKNILQQTEIHFDKVLEVFVKYILIPLVLLYIAILYAYGFKILFEWELPKGWVSYLVTALALLGFVVQVVINPVQKTAKAWTIHRYYPWFYYALLPLIVLLFIAIYRRIADYGVTENRYFVVLIAFWILAMSLYQLFARKRRLIVLPISLFVLALSSSFGSWGAFRVSRRSQVAQFEKVFASVVANDKKATSLEFAQLKSIIGYLNDRSKVSDLDGITGISMKETFQDTLPNDRNAYGWINADQILDSLGITLRPGELDDGVINGTHLSYYNDQSKNRNYDIAEFSYFSPIFFNSHTPGKLKIGNFACAFDSENVLLSLLSEDGKEIMQIPLKDKLIDLAKFGDQLYRVDEKELVLESENDSVLVRLVFRDLAFNIKRDSVNIDNAHAFMFLKEK